jgi:hypothetical protein
MTVYVPDRWLVVEVTNAETNKAVKKVLAAWYGTFAGDEHWQLNSGIKLAKECNDRFEFHSYSGNLYVCYKSLYGVTSLSNGILKHWQRQGMPVKVLEEYDVRSTD